MQGNEKWAEIKDGALLDGKTLTTTLKANTVTTSDEFEALFATI